jgi:raffinose/stachyose/melibiose transport system permease protein
MAQLTMGRGAARVAVPQERQVTLLKRIMRSKQAYLILIPTFVLVLTFNYYPAFSALFHSVFDWNGYNVERFIGLGNFQLMLQDATLMGSVGNLFKLTAFSLAVNLTFPLLAGALIFHLKNLRLAYFYRVLYVIPMVVPGMVVLGIWKSIYSPQIGLINMLLKVTGLASWARPWLGDFNLALGAVMFIGFPWIAGMSTLIYLAGFQAIPTELLDAAAIDGAGVWNRFWRVEFPLVMSQIKLIVILTVIGALQNFATIMVMTNGGPGVTTMVPGLWLYRNALMYGKMGYACAIGTALFVITLFLTYLNTRYLKSSVEFIGA